jgi:hypothetical protein
VIEANQTDRAYLDYVYCIQGPDGYWRDVTVASQRPL